MPAAKDKNKPKAKSSKLNVEQKYLKKVAVEPKVPLPNTPPAPVVPIENYGVIGDMNSCALVSIAGSIDFLCLPEFDGPTVFASILDPEKGGYFKVSMCPHSHTDEIKHTQMYLPDSNILLTRYLSDDGIGQMSDFMPVGSPDGARRIIRRIKAVSGTLTFLMECRPRFNYALTPHTTKLVSCGATFTPDAGPDLHNNPIPSLRLRSSLPLKVTEEGDIVGEFTLSEGETLTFILEEVTAETSPAENPDFAVDAFKQTINFWQEWVGQSNYKGLWRDEVVRSALALKLMTSEKHGSIIAAPTFGLPETIGKGRNWDYRYTWIRDASYTVYAFLRLGYTKEATAFIDWLSRNTYLNRDSQLDKSNEASGELQIMYRIDGDRGIPTETELKHFSGYLNSQPVQVGNAAYDQLQLDIYGTLMDAVYLSDEYGDQISFDAWQHLHSMIDWVCRHWSDPDEGIWEHRSGRQEFLHSRLMSWVTVDRGIRLSRKRSLPSPIEKWIAARDAIFNDIHKNFWDDERKCFTQHKGSDTLDASALMMPLVRFISPTDPRWISTMEAIEKTLMIDSLVHRYNHDSDGLEGEEGTFTMCSFWYIEALARSGDLKKARFLFDKMLSFANHLGLFAEELGFKGQHLGNFPQALTHLSLISTAYYLNKHINK